MRISDWSSDVCSSDLGDHADQPLAEREPRHMHRFLLESARRKKFERAAAQQVDRTDFAMKTFPDDPDDLVDLALRARPRRHHLVQTGQDGTGGLGGGRGRWRGVRHRHPDRKSVVEGKSGSVRVDLGGRRSIKKKKRGDNYKKTRDPRV